MRFLPNITNRLGLVRIITIGLAILFIFLIQTFYYLYEEIVLVHIALISLVIIAGAIGLVEFSLSLTSGLNKKLQKQIRKNRETETALRKSERLYKTLINTSPDVVVVTDLDGVIQYVSNGTTRLLGCDDQNDLVGRSVFEFMMGDDMPKAKELLKTTLAEGECRNVPLRLQKRDGSIIYAEFCAAIIKGSNGHAEQFMTTIRDVSERKKTVLAQKENDEIFRAIFDSAQDLIFVKDKDLNYKMMNHMVGHYFGKSIPELLGKTDCEIFGKEIGRKVRKQDLEVLKGNIVNVEEKRPINGIMRDMHVIKVPFRNAAGEITGLCGIARDITAKKEAERQIANQKQKEQTYLDIANVIILALDTKGNITMINKKGASIIGREKEELIGTNWTQNFIPEENRKQMEIVFSTFVTGQIEPPDYYESAIVTHSGERRIIGWRNAILKNERGRITGILSSGEDITENKQIQEALEESEEMYRLLVENANEAIVVVQQGMLKFANTRSSELVEYSEKELLSLPFADFIHPDDRAMVAERHQKLLKGDWVPDTYDFRVVTKFGSIKWIELNGIKISWQHKPATLNFISDISTRKEAEDIQRVLYGISNSVNTTNDLVELSEYIKQQIGHVLDTTNFYIALYNKESDTISLPFFADEKDQFSTFPAQKTLTGYIIRTGQPLLAREKELDELEQAGEIELVGTASKIWLGVPLQVGNEIIGVVVVQSYTDPNLYTSKDMEILKFVSGQMALAIERKKGEDQIKASLHEKEVLLKEIHHRVKNNLQIIHSLLYLQSKKTRDKESRDLFINSQNRVRSMALIHEKLYRSRDLSRVDFGEYTRSLTDHLKNIYGSDGKRIEISVQMQNVLLPIDTAIPVGLIVNELVSNSLKYAFPNGNAGQIKIEMFPQNDADVSNKPGYSLVVRDNGIGLPPDLEQRQSKSLGMILVKNLTTQLEGLIEHKSDNGAFFKIDFHLI